MVSRFILVKILQLPCIGLWFVTLAIHEVTHPHSVVIISIQVAHLIIVVKTLKVVHYTSHTTLLLVQITLIELHLSQVLWRFWFLHFLEYSLLIFDDQLLLDE